MIRRRSSGRSVWLTPWRIAVAFAVLAGGAGLLGLQILQREVHTRAVHSAELSAQLIGSLVVDRNVTADILHSGSVDAQSRADMDAEVADLVARHQLAGLEVWAVPDGHLIYADRRHPSGETRLPPREVFRAGQGSFSTVSATGRLDGPTLDVFLPLDGNRDGAIDAVAEVLLPADPVNEQITQFTRLLDGGALLVALSGVFLLWLVRRRQRRRAYAMRHDVLTGLGNRVLLTERIREVFARGGEGAVLLVDLDGFKEINETLGRHAGDDLLITVAGRLRAGTRSGDTVVRLGGDEFAILLADPSSPDSAQAAAQRLHHAIRQPATAGLLTVEAEASIGIAVAPEHGTDIDTLLRRADVAMSHAKHNGLGIASYDPAADTRDELQLTVLAELRHAITAGQLRLHYQPKCGPDGSVGQVEALVRWQHPERGLLAPYAFIPLAERTSLIKPLTAWVITEAVRQCAAWRAEGQPLCVAVNISARNLADPELPNVVLGAIAAAAIPAGTLELEITETAITTDPQRAHETLHRLRAMGLRVSIDDFGVGYTSLSQLGELPVDALKIDRMFVADILTNPAHEAVVRNVIQLARDLGLTTIGEGVESQDIWDRLTEFGCDEIQGYILTPPLPPDQLTAWLAHWRCRVTLATTSTGTTTTASSNTRPN